MKVEKLLESAMEHAVSNKHEFVTTEHLLWALMHDSMAADAVQSIAGKRAKQKIMQESSSHVVAQLPKKLREGQIPSHTTAIRRVFKRAESLAQDHSQSNSNSFYLLLSLVHEENSHSYFFLRRAGVNGDKLLEWFDKNQMQDSNQALEQFCHNLSLAAKNNELDPVIGRSHEIDQTVQALMRKKKNNVVLVGAAGVGKTALAEGLAQRIVNDQVPDKLKDHVVYSLDLGALVAGTKFRGDFESRIKTVLDTVAQMGNVILFVDEIHMLMGAGSSGTTNTMDAANLMKPALARGELKAVGATTPQEYERSFQRDRALARRFQRIDINEPTVETCHQIIQRSVPRYQSHHGIRYTPAAVKAVVDLSHQYIKNWSLPDKAFDVLDSVGSWAAANSVKTVTQKHVANTVSQLAKISPKVMTASPSTNIKNLKRDLKKQVFGQDSAIDQIEQAVILARSGVSQTQGPVGSFLLVGPTGVGKTHFAQMLAQTLHTKLVVFDMSEYQESHSVSKLIGAPPGYVGHGDGAAGSGLLISAIDENPSCVLLLDEIEKAAPQVTTVLLQLMDRGVVTSGTGKSVNCSNIILLMTSNLGAEDAQKNTIGFAEPQHDHQALAYQSAVNRYFAPEFRNRLDAVIEFGSLGQEQLLQIVDQHIKKFSQSLVVKNCTLEISSRARRWLAQKGHNPQMGARPMARVVREHLHDPVARMLLFGSLKRGGHIIVDTDGNVDQLAISCQKP